MSETAPTFTPSPGIPNASHQRFYEALAKETGSTAGTPTKAPGQFHTAATLQKFAEVEKANAPKAAAASTAPTVDTIKAYQANRGKPTPSVVLDGRPDQMAKIDAEMRAAGQQTGTDTATAKENLIAIKRRTPLQAQTAEFKRAWEAEFARLDANGETPAAEAKPATVPAGTNAPAPSPAVDSGIDFVMKNSNAEGMMVSHSIPKSLLSGYTLPSGAKIHAETAIRMLADARRDGVPQSVVDAYLRAIK